MSNLSLPGSADAKAEKKSSKPSKLSTAIIVEAPKDEKNTVTVTVAKKDTANATWVKIAHEVTIHGEKHGLYIAKPPNPKAREVKEVNPENGFALNPFFNVGITHEKKKANVTYYTESHKGFTLPG